MGHWGSMGWGAGMWGMGLLWLLLIAGIALVVVALTRGAARWTPAPAGGTDPAGRRDTRGPDHRTRVRAGDLGRAPGPR